MEAADMAALSASYNEHPEVEADILAKMLRRRSWPRTSHEIDFSLTRIAFGLIDCWVWVGPRDSGGYGIWARHGAIDKAHRAAWRLFRGAIPPSRMVLHSCDVRNCVNPEHLWLGSQLDNMRDCVLKGRHRSGEPRRGEANHYAKLKEADVLRARALRVEGFTYKAIAKIIGVSTMTAFRAVTGQSWSHI